MSDKEHWTTAHKHHMPKQNQGQITRRDAVNIISYIKCIMYREYYVSNTSYHITKHWIKWYITHQIEKKRENSRKSSNTTSFQSHQTQLHQLNTQSSSLQHHLRHQVQHFVLQSPQHRHNTQEKAGKHVPTRFKPLPPHLTPSTSRSRRTQLKTRCPCGLSARRPAAACPRPISSRCRRQSLWRRGGGDVNRCKIQPIYSSTK